MRKIICLLIFLLFIAVPIIHATVGSEFLLYDTSSSAAGLAGTYTGRLSGLEGIHYNPAALNNVERFSIYVENITFKDEMNFKYIALGDKLKQFCIAVYTGIHFMDNIAIYDTDGFFENEIRYNDILVGGSIGLKYKQYYTGLNIKYIQRTIGEYQATGIGIDIGILRKFMHDRISIGAGLQNIGPKIKFYEKRENLPSKIEVGINGLIIKKKIIEVFLLADMGKIFADAYIIKTGLEIVIKKIIYLRLGKSFTYEKTLSTGIGLQIPIGKKLKTEFNYALQIQQGLGLSHVIGGMVIF